MAIERRPPTAGRRVNLPRLRALDDLVELAAIEPHAVDILGSSRSRPLAAHDLQDAPSTAEQFMDVTFSFGSAICVSLWATARGQQVRITAAMCR